jgi:hypothetical protein
MGAGGPFSGCKVAESWSELAPPSSYNVKSELGNITSQPTYFLAYTGVNIFLTFYK